MYVVKTSVDWRDIHGTRLRVRSISLTLRGTVGRLEVAESSVRSRKGVLPSCTISAGHGESGSPCSPQKLKASEPTIFQVLKSHFVAAISHPFSIHLYTHLVSC